jgi:predicted secreted hydrolase
MPIRVLLPLLLVLATSGCLPSVYDQPYPIRPVELPADDAAHDAPFEWWYWVGHLETEDGRELAFQLTFFEAFAPPELRVLGLPSHWWFEKELVAHAAAVDLDAGEHAMAQRGFALSEGEASRERLDVSVNDWRAVRHEDGVSHRLTFAVGGTAFDLVLTPGKPASRHGDPPGVQSMGPGGVSYYVSHTRMEVRGSVAPDCFFPEFCGATPVTGQAWFDHQWGDFRIDRLGGWDWFALQLDDGAEVMLYLIRDQDGAYVAAEGSYVTPSGRTIGLAREDFALAPTGATWNSDETGAVYPAGWTVEVPRFDVDVTVRPLVADQEMDTRRTTGIVYWEGAVAVDGTRPGVGFVELTNYDRLPFEPARLASGDASE